MRLFKSEKLNIIITLILAVIIIIASFINSQRVHADASNVNWYDSAGSRFDDVTQWFSNSKNNRRTPNNDISTRATMATGIYVIPAITDN